MSIGAQLLTLFSVTGVLQGFFFGSYILQLKTGDRLSNRLFALLLISVSLKALTSAAIYYLKGDAGFLNAIGISTTAIIGPLLYLYFKSKLKSSVTGNAFIHFSPSLLVLATLVLVKEAGIVLNVFTLVHLFIYVMLSAQIFVRHKEPEHTSWLTTLLTCMSIFGIAYLLNAFKVLCVILCPFFYAFLIYILSYYALKHYQVFIKTRNKKQIDHDTVYKKKLDELMHVHKLYQNPSMNLTLLADRIGLSVHATSHLINTQFNQTFSCYVNAHRLAEAKSMLASSGYKHVKVATIAFECGFNSLSVFNVAFKKATGLTPSQYREKFLV